MITTSDEHRAPEGRPFDRPGAQHSMRATDELGHHADPPMTKDAVAGRIRRLLAMADKRAIDLGIPGTDANLPPDYEDA